MVAQPAPSDPRTTSKLEVSTFPRAVRYHMLLPPKPPLYSVSGLAPSQDHLLCLEGVMIAGSQNPCQGLCRPPGTYQDLGFQRILPFQGVSQKCGSIFSRLGRRHLGHSHHGQIQHTLKICSVRTYGRKLEELCSSTLHSISIGTSHCLASTGVNADVYRQCLTAL